MQNYKQKEHFKYCSSSQNSNNSSCKNVNQLCIKLKLAKLTCKTHYFIIAKVRSILFAENNESVDAEVDENVLGVFARFRFSY